MNFSLYNLLDVNGVATELGKFYNRINILFLCFFWFSETK